MRLGRESTWELMPKAAALKRKAPEQSTAMVERFMVRSRGTATFGLWPRRVRMRAGFVTMIERAPLPICRRWRIRAWDSSDAGRAGDEMKRAGPRTGPAF